MNKKTRSVRVTNNPVASASEYKRFIENIYSHLLGLSVNNSTRRSKLDGSFGKGAFGTSICAYGVHETQNRGSLHHHLILWVSIPPSLLQKACEDEKFWDEFAKILESQYQCEIDLKDIEKHVIKEYLVEDKDFNHDNFQNPMPFSVPNQESEIVNDEYMKDFFKICSKCAVHDHLHKHTFTCAKHKNGNCYCRLAYPQPMENKTGPLLITYDLDENGNHKLSKRNTRAVKTTRIIEKESPRNTVEEQLQVDKRAITWALKRPELDVKKFDDFCCKSDVDIEIYKADVIEFISKFIPNDWLSSLEKK